MQPMFESLLRLMKEPLHPKRGVQTDDSILLIYPPERELDFREQLVDGCFPALDAQGSLFHALDLTGFMFEDLSEDAVKALQEEEFDDYEWMLHGLSQRVETSLRRRLEALATPHQGHQPHRLQHCRTVSAGSLRRGSSQHEGSSCPGRRRVPRRGARRQAPLHEPAR